MTIPKSVAARVAALCVVAIAAAVLVQALLGLRGTGAPSLAEVSQLPVTETADSQPLTRAADPSAAKRLQSSKAVAVDPSQFRQLLPRDAIRPIYDPQFSSADDADIDPKELVIGVAINGESRAYPIGPLARREIVNDVVAGVPILVTW